MLLSSKLVRELIDGGVHFGHRVSRWNPKMAPYIFDKRKLIHIINVKETMKGLLRSKAYLRSVVQGGKDIVFVGTKRQARLAVQDEASRCGMPYVNERWLGGTLTNFRTIRSRLSRLDELEALEQDGQLAAYGKKRESQLRREMKKIRRNLEGIRSMERMPGALFAVDVRREHIALKEARKIGIPTVCIIDTDSDPDLADIPIPANDDAMRVLELLIKEIADSIVEGKSGRGKETEAAAQGPRRRSERATTARAEPEEGHPETAANADPDAVSAAPATPQSTTAD